MDAMKYQRASLEAKVHDLQRELEQQAFRTPESDEPVKRQLELTVDETSERGRIWRWKRRRLYELTPMQTVRAAPILDGDGHSGASKARWSGARDNERGRDLKVRELHVREEVNLRAWWHLGRRASNRKGDKGPGKVWVSQRRKPQPSSLVDLQLPMFGKNDREKAVVAWLMRCPMLITYLVDKDKKQEGPESVKPGTATLPVLAEPSDTAPIDLADWLTMVEPAMTDLSDSSGEWWELVVSEAKAWYKQYIKLRPIQRASSKIEPSAELQKPKWARVEKRAISMLLSSVPTTVKEELVATRTLSPLGLVSKTHGPSINQGVLMNAPSSCGNLKIRQKQGRQAKPVWDSDAGCAGSGGPPTLA